MPDPAVASGAILVVDRGGCSFADKAFYAQQAGAVGMVLANSDQAIPRLPAAFMTVKEEVDPEITIPVVAVRRTAGLALKKIIEREETVVGSIVAKRWTKEGTHFTGPCSEKYSKQHSTEEKVFYNGVEVTTADGGEVTVLSGTSKGDSFEYLRANFGGPLPNYPSFQAELYTSEPKDACEAFQNAGLMAGKVALVFRGGCPFTVKAKMAEAAGAVGMLIVNSDNVLLTMAEGTITEEEVTIFTAMIGKDAGVRISAAAEKGVSISFSLTEVMAADWDSLETTSLIEDWPEDEEGRKDRLEQLLSLHDPARTATGHPTRLAMVRKIYEETEAYWSEEGNDSSEEKKEL
eukprot:g1785.t1